MKNYLDLPDINTTAIDVSITLSPIVNNGAPIVDCKINNKQMYCGAIVEQTTLHQLVPLLEPIQITIQLSNKQYSDKLETAVEVTSIVIDGNEIVNQYHVPVSYANDQHVNYQGFYLGFNGTWSLLINEPFYRWLHRAQGHGWILEPTI
jgi:hypothetical protein